MLCFTCIGCAVAPDAGLEENAPPADAPAVSAQPLPQQPTPPPEKRAEDVVSAFRDSFHLNTGRYFIVESLNYADILAQMDTWKGLAEEVQKATQDAFLLACLKMHEPAGECVVELSGWKLIASLYHRFGERAGEILRYHSEVEAVIGEDGVTMHVSYNDLRGMIASEAGEGTFGPKLTYAYLNTIYDDDGNEISYSHYALSEDYLINLHDPLPGSHIKDGWYKDRDRGLRKHTGTDIRSPEDTPILSCTDGVVCNIGSNEGAGNYVVVLDDDGFEYHYYHMVRLTDFLRVGERVKKGDVIGHVGNTGNSAANHLHLTVISPAYTYINPYLMLRDMRKLQKEAGN